MFLNPFLLLPLQLDCDLRGFAISPEPAQYLTFRYSASVGRLPIGFYHTVCFTPKFAFKFFSHVKRTFPLKSREVQALDEQKHHLGVGISRGGHHSDGGCPNS